jgi:hypothetical protein
MPVQGSPQMGMPRLPFMQFAPPQGQPMPQPGSRQPSGGMFAPQIYAAPPAAAAAQPSRGLFGGRFDNMGQRFTDVMRENPMAWSAVASGLMDKRQNNNVTFSDITGNAMRGGAYDTAQKDKKEEKDKTTKAENATDKYLKRRFPDLSDEEVLAIRSNPTILSEVIKGSSGDATDDMREWIQVNRDLVAAGKPPIDFMDYQIRMKEAGRSSTTVNVNEKIPVGWKLDPSDPTGQAIMPMPGGPGEQLPGELAGRTGLAANFLEQAPKLREEIAGGGVTGLQDRANAGWNDQSKQAGIYRKIKSGTDALQRMLTGAGMPMSEAKEYASRYLPTYTDDAASAADKLDQLVQELKSIEERVMRGRGGTEEAAPEDPLGIR